MEQADGVYVTISELVQLQHKAKGYSFRSHQPVHSILSGRHGSRLRGRGLDFEELRGYLPGDDVRTIDWKVTVRMREPFVRVYTEEKERPVILIVDQRQSMFFGTRTMMKSVASAHIAALSAWRCFQSGDRVGALVFNDQEIEQITAHRSRSRVMQILNAVVKQNNALRVDSSVTSNAGMLNKVLDQASRMYGHDCLIVVISDFAGFDSETRRLLLAMSQHNDVLAFLVYDPSATTFDSSNRAGRLVVSQGELQIELNLKDKRVFEPVSEFTSKRLSDVQEVLKKIQIPIFPVDTGEDVYLQIRRLLGNEIHAV